MVGDAKSCGAALTIAIDGPDGAGKSTLSRALVAQWRAIELPRTSAVGLMPGNFEERTVWFRNECPLVTARTYLAAHRLRLAAIRECKQRNHFRLNATTRFDPPTLIVLERGPHSALAYAWAGVRIDTALPEFCIDQYVWLHGEDLYRMPVDLEVLLCPEASNASGVLAQRLAVPPLDAERERRLIDGQIQALGRLPTPTWPVLRFNPLMPLQELVDAVLTLVRRLIEERAGKNNAARYRRPSSRVTLLEAVAILQKSEFHAAVWLVGGVVEKGYSDNDIDACCDNPADEISVRKALETVTDRIHCVPMAKVTSPWRLRVR